MTGKQRVVNVKLSKISIPFYVRVGTDQGRVLHFAELYENDVKLPPLLITENNELVDGRHRKEALELLDRTEAPCTFIKVGNEGELIVEALKANMGGALPPQDGDLAHCVELLIARGLGTRKIGNMLEGTLPRKITRRLVADVQSKIAKRKIQSAKEAVISGDFTVKAAANKFEVDVDSLKKALGGKKKDKQSPFKKAKTEMSKRFRVLGQKNANTLKSMMEAVEDGEASIKETESILSQWKKSLSNQSKASKGWEDRVRKLKKELKS